jgi:RND family efflux transporter MFP subunit
MEFSQYLRNPSWARNLRKPRFYIPLILIVALVLFFLFRGGDELEGIETQVAAYRTVALVVSETGSVTPSEEAALSFLQPGRITEIFVVEGDQVSRGDPLIAIDDTAQYAERLAAEARVRAEEARLTELVTGTRDVDIEAQVAAVEAAEIALENARDNLERVQSQQDTLLGNARAALLSNDLEAHLTEGGREGTDFDFSPPTISGTYTSAEEGEYVIALYRSNAASNYSFTYEGLEDGTGEVSTTEPQPLGTRGLYIEFPDDFARGNNIEWTIRVPNERSATFVTQQNALRAAEEARESAILAAKGSADGAEASLAQAEATLRATRAATREERIAAQAATVEQMRASLEAVAYAHESATLRAPFSGTITEILAHVGEVSGSTPALRLISDNELEVEVEIPEADIADVSVGDRATITFDAYNDLTVEADVSYVASSASIRETVPSFPVRIVLSDIDERVRAGLSADVEIRAAERENVLAVPARAIFQEDGVAYVRTFEDGELEKVAVTTGLRGTDGFVEITSGLAEGDEVVIFIESARLAELEARED